MSDGTSIVIPEPFPAPLPLVPYAGPILALHRGKDGYITFHRKLQDGRWENMFAERADKLERMFPQFAADLARDSYYSINGFYRPQRKHENIRYLNSCYVDIDVRDVGVTAGTLFGRAYDLVDAQRLPPPSLFCLSGRGVWFFWLLVENPGLGPPRAFPEKVIAHQAIQAELVRKFSADVAAKDISRVTRVPGSINSKSGTVVAYGIFRAGSGTPEYTLESLAAALGTELPQLRPRRRESLSSPEASTRARRGWAALWQHRFQDFQVLRQVRGGFRLGCRNRAAYIYAIILRGCGLAESAVRDAVTQLGRECSPPLSQQEINGATEQSGRSERRGWTRDEVIAAYLQVTPEESRFIPRWSVQDSLLEVNCVIRGTRETREQRRQAITDIVASLGRVPSTRVMSKLLRERGIVISHVRIAEDYKCLELPTLYQNLSLLP